MENLNVEKLSKSGFINRLLDFVKDYEKARNVKYYDDVVDWFIDQKYTYIKSFLSSVPNENIGEKQSLLDRKKALYEEFISFYE